jgi:WD40 repeat protein
MNNKNLQNNEQNLKDIPLKWNIGDVIADLYEVTGVLGEGGMGIVYKVHHKEWDVDLAVKSIRPEILNDTGLENFIKEAETWVNLGLHPNTVSCYYVRKLGEVPRIFSEYIDGGSLKEWIQTKKLYEGTKEEILKRILDISIQTAWGLQYAHEQGLVHQDVKPANILMSSDGSIKVTDFGIAKARFNIGEIYTPSKDGTILVPSGAMSRLYCSPEQAEGKPVSRKTDIWSWALSIFEMFTGGVCWASGTIAATVLNEHLLNGNNNQSIPKTPKSLAELLKHCFQCNPDDRPNDFEHTSKVLVDIYSEINKSKYYRVIPKSADLLADSLNNKAISFLDLDKYERAEENWKEALKINPQHLQSIYNYGYINWKNDKINGSNFINQLESIKSEYLEDNEYWLSIGWIYYELGNVDAINEIQNSKYRINNIKFNRALTEENKPIGREIKCFDGLNDDVALSVCFSPDGRYALSGSNEGYIHLWDIQLGKEIWKMEGHSSSVNSVCFSPDGLYALSGSNDCDIQLWDIQSQKAINKMKGHISPVSSICFSRDGKLALSGSNDKTVRLWEIHSGKEIGIFKGHTDKVNTVIFSPNNKFALSGSNDKTVRLWDIESHAEIRIFEDHKKEVITIKFSNDNRTIISGSSDNTIIFWEVLTGKKVRVIEGNMYAVNSIDISSNNHFVLSGFPDNTIRLFESYTGKEVRILKGHKDTLKCITYSPDNRYALSGSWDNTIRLWEIYFPEKNNSNNYPLLNKIKTVMELTGKAEIINIQLNEIDIFWKRKKYFEAYRVIENLEKSYKDVDRLNILNIKNKICVESGFRRKKFKEAHCLKIFEGHTEPVSSVKFSCDNKYAISGSWDNTIRLWDIYTGKEVKRFVGHTNKVNSVCCSPNGRFILSGSCDRSVRIWDMFTGKEIRSFDGHKDIVNSVCFSPDGNFILSASSDMTIKLWNLDSRKELRTFAGHIDSVAVTAFSPYGSQLISGSKDATARLWDVKSGKLIRLFKGHENCVFCLSISPNGKYLLTGSFDKSVRLWDISDSKELMKFSTEYVIDISFFPHGNYALFVNNNTSFHLLNVAIKKMVGEFYGHNSIVLSLSFSDNGRYVISGSIDKRICLWEFDWDWEFVEPTDWDEEARPYLEIFLELHRPYDAEGLSRTGIPIWSTVDFKKFYEELKNKGFGYIRPNGIITELEKMTRNYKY